MNRKIKFLIADDERPTIITLKKLIEIAFPKAVVYTAEDGLEAWEKVQAFKPDIVLSDISMPGMDGIQLLIKIRAKEELNNIYFIVLTARTSKDDHVSALERGADDFLTKPIVSDTLKARLRGAARIVTMRQDMSEENKLLIELADELENYIQDMIKLAVKFLQARIPTSFDALKRVAQASVWIARQFKESDGDFIRDVEIASYLSHAGKVFLPDSLINQPVSINGLPTHKLMNQVPITAREIVSSVRRFSDIADILYYLYENFDGTGFPKKKQSWEIPLGSRIIRGALDYEVIRENFPKTPKETISSMKRQSNRLYDKRVIILLEQYVRSVAKEDFDPNSVAVHLQDLVPGMILSRDIVTNSGLMLMPEGAVLKASAIEKIININTTDPILGNVYVRKS